MKYKDREPVEHTDEYISKNRRMLDILLAILSILFIVVLAGMNYVKPLDKSYSPEAFYVGANIAGEDENPLDVYNRMKGSGGVVSPDGQCKTSYDIIEASDLLAFNGEGNAIPRVMTDTDFMANTLDELQVWGEQFTDSSDGDVNHWYLWKDTADGDDMRIISPYISFTFRNSNFAAPKDGAVDIILGSNGDANNYIKVVRARNWFCHMDKEELVTQHTTKIGDTALTDELRGRSGASGFAVIGKATYDTYIVGVSKDTNGDEVEVSPAEILSKN